MSLSNIVTQKAATTKWTNEAISQLLEYVVTYRNDVIIYPDSDMILAAHDDAAYLSVSKPRSLPSAYTMLSKSYPNPRHSRPVLTIAQMINFSCPRQLKLTCGTLRRHQRHDTIAENLSVK